MGSVCELRCASDANCPNAATNCVLFDAGAGLCQLTAAACAAANAGDACVWRAGSGIAGTCIPQGQAASLLCLPSGAASDHCAEGNADPGFWDLAKAQLPNGKCCLEGAPVLPEQAYEPSAFCPAGDYCAVAPVTNLYGAIAGAGSAGVCRNLCSTQTVSCGLGETCLAKGLDTWGSCGPNTAGTTCFADAFPCSLQASQCCAPEVCVETSSQVTQCGVCGVAQAPCWNGPNDCCPGFFCSGFGPGACAPCIPNGSYATSPGDCCSGSWGYSGANYQLCTPKRALAEPCVNPADCLSNVCDAVTQACGDSEPLGEACYFESDCDSGICDPVNSVCNPPQGQGGWCYLPSDCDSGICCPPAGGNSAQQCGPC